METKNIRRRDRISAWVSVLLIFGICTSLCLIFFFAGNAGKWGTYKQLIVKKSERQQQFCKEQADYQASSDSLFRRIERFNPGVNASFEENDIKFLINDLKNVHERHAWDKRYKVFYHMGAFYEMWFADKKILWSRKANIGNFSRKLEQCEMGLTKKEDELTNKQKRN